MNMLSVVKPKKYSTYKVVVNPSCRLPYCVRCLHVTRVFTGLPFSGFSSFRAFEFWVGLSGFSIVVNGAKLKPEYAIYFPTLKRG